MSYESVIKSATYRWPPMIAHIHGAGIELYQWLLRKHIGFFQIKTKNRKTKPATSDPISITISLTLTDDERS